MTVFSEAAEWLQDQRETNATIDVTYGRGVSSEAMKAVIGRTVYEEMDAEGAAFLQFESRDFIIAISEFDTVAGPPQVGDLITEVQDTVTYLYKVTSIGSHYAGRDTETHYRRDAHRLTYRIHTKRVSEE